ncbi:hypothetical protein BGX21_003965, partial [Mortierella sp. AD011]
MSHIPHNTSAQNLASANDKSSSPTSDDTSGPAPYTQTVLDSPQVDTAVDEGSPFASSASPTSLAPAVRDPLAFTILRYFGPAPHPSKDELNTAYVGTHNSKALCRRLMYL